MTRIAARLDPTSFGNALELTHVCNNTFKRVVNLFVVFEVRVNPQTAILPKRAHGGNVFKHAFANAEAPSQELPLHKRSTANVRKFHSSPHKLWNVTKKV